MRIHFRSPILITFGKSPFDNLLKHASKVTECIKLLKDSIVSYSDGDFDRSCELAKEVSRTEHEADLIKGNIRAHLPRGLLMPVDKGIFLMLLKEQDAILDYAEDSVEWLNMKRVIIPDEIKQDFLNHLMKVLEAVEALENVVSNLKEIVVASVPTTLRNSIKQAIKDVHKKEWEADNLERVLSKKIFELNISAIDVFFLLKAVDLIDQIANHAENAGDRVRAMLAR
ncbi:TIGR00153 family protein [bacterium]|nr:TIGR00153 family protein [bacterium]